MADIRIKDLTTTASSTASDDFIAVDGTTNGTRKLNAFSPTFGGNATVTGTLTVNSTSSFAGTATIAVGNGVAATIGLNQTGVANAYLTQKATSGDLALGNGGGDQLTIAKATGVVSIASTSSSTSTSSGALVVGNGTSGGLGVGGDVNIGGTVTVTSGVAPQFSIAPSGGRPIRFNASTGFMSLQANPGGWYLGVRFLGSAGTHRGNIWAGGTDDALDNINIGDASYSPWLRASSTGISVVAPTALASSENGQLRIVDSSNSNRKLFFGFDNTVSPSGVGYVQSLLSGTTTIPLQLQPLGGGITIGPSPSSTDSLVSATAAGTSGTTKVLAHLENNFATAALNNAAQLRFKVFNNSVGDGEIAAINGISDSVTAGARTTALSFLTGQQTVGVVERMRISGTGTVSLSGGLLTISKSGAGSTLEVNADSGYDSKISLQRAATNRWTIECDSSDTLRFKSLGSTQIVAVTSSNLTFSGDLLFFANSTYDIGTTANRVRQIFVRDIYSTFYTPASATDTGTAGRICYDSNYIYICTATNTWKRAAISTW